MITNDCDHFQREETRKTANCAPQGCTGRFNVHVDSTGLVSQNDTVSIELSRMHRPNNLFIT